jgi:hypothetical protein
MNRLILNVATGYSSEQPSSGPCLWITGCSSSHPAIVSQYWHDGPPRMQPSGCSSMAFSAMQSGQVPQ